MYRITKLTQLYVGQQGRPKNGDQEQDEEPAKGLVKMWSTGEQSQKPGEKIHFARKEKSSTVSNT